MTDIVFPLMYNNLNHNRLEITRYYLENGTSMRKTAEKFGVNYRSVFNWVKLFKEGGEQRLLATYRKPWNRTDKILEEKIALLKEKKPGLTVRDAQEILKKRNINISIKGIWGIWKRYGYAGFNKAGFCHDFTRYIAWSKEAKSKFEDAQWFLERGRTKAAARILNAIPALPNNELIARIPNRLLNWKRKTEKVASSMGESPVYAYIERTKKLYEALRKREFYYSAMRIGVMEVVALTLHAVPEKVLKKIGEIRKIVNLSRHHGHPGTSRRTPEILFSPRFSILMEEGLACSVLSRIKEATSIAGMLRTSLKNRKPSSPFQLLELAILYVNLDNHREAEHLILNAFKRVNQAERKEIRSRLANISLRKGDWKKAEKFAHDARFPAWVSASRTDASDSRRYLFLSRLTLLRGEPQKAISLCTEALSRLKNENFHKRTYIALFTMASAYASIGDKAKAKKVLSNALQFLKKKNIRKYMDVVRIILSQNDPSASPGFSTNSNARLLPSVKLALLLKNGDFSRAFSFAKERYLMLEFHRQLVFFPDAVIELFERGKSTGLPRSILRLPVFNKEIPVFTIKFLGGLIVHRRYEIQDNKGNTPDKKEYMRQKLSPKDAAFLIHLALRAGEPGKEVELEWLYDNFWHRAKHPARNLSHVLVRIKNALKMPSHLLEIVHKESYSVLINKGIYFTTDWQEFERAIARAYAFLRAEEWGFARKEFLSAFSLFRGEPFQKMYDDESDDIRRAILNRFEKEVLKFAEECTHRRNRKDPLRVLENAKRVIKYATWDIDEAIAKRS